MTMGLPKVEFDNHLLDKVAWNRAQTYNSLPSTGLLNYLASYRIMYN